MLAVLALPLAACDDEPSPAPEPTPPSIALGDLDTESLTVLRAEFCDRVPGTAVAEALGLEEGAEPERSRSWTNGDRVRVGPGSKRGIRDVVHEHGCRWSTAGVTAAAWVFAPPVAPARARDLRADALATRGCSELAAAPAYGSPSLALRCEGTGGTTLSFRGLFGDAWLTCTLGGGAAAADVDRAGRWCAAVAQAAAD